LLYTTGIRKIKLGAKKSIKTIDDGNVSRLKNKKGSQEIETLFYFAPLNIHTSNQIVERLKHIYKLRHLIKL